MSGSDAVWPDGAREAVQEALWGNVVDDTLSCRVREATDILTALEPFVQQRIEAEVGTLVAELREYQQVIRDHDNTATPAVLRGLLDQFKTVRAEVARLREDGERWRYARNNGTWRRGDDPHDGKYTEWAIRVAPGADLSCAAMVDHAIDAARSARGGEG